MFRRRYGWLWPGRVPLGKLTLLIGDPGLGKSFVTLDIAARVSRGLPLPALAAEPAAAAGPVRSCCSPPRTMCRHDSSAARGGRRRPGRASSS